MTYIRGHHNEKLSAHSNVSDAASEPNRCLYHILRRSHTPTKYRAHLLNNPIKFITPSTRPSIASSKHFQAIHHWINHPLPFHPSTFSHCLCHTKHTVPKEKTSLSPVKTPAFSHLHSLESPV
jgi:hypothetical protein